MKKEKKITGIARILCIIFTILSIVAVVFFMGAGVSTIRTFDDEVANAKVFDSYEDTEELRYSEFLFISEYFAFFEVNESQKLYFILDSNMVPSIVCIEDGDFNMYEANYNYTFDTTGELPEPEVAYAVGRPVLIEEELKLLAIEYFNSFWGEEVLTEENFEEYVGNYYLDTSLVEKVIITTLMTFFFLSIVFLVIAIVLIVLLCLNKKPTQEPSVSIEAIDTIEGEEPSYFNTVQPELEINPVKEHKIAGMVGAFVGAIIGCIAWAAVYRLGYMAGIVGILTGWLAMTGYKLLAKKNSVFGSVIAIIFSIFAIFVGNYIGYAWVITDASAGRGEFLEIMSILPQLLTEYGAWGDFIKDLVVGFVLVGIGSIGNLKKLVRK